MALIDYKNTNQKYGPAKLDHRLQKTVLDIRENGKIHVGSNDKFKNWVVCRRETLIEVKIRIGIFQWICVFTIIAMTPLTYILRKCKGTIVSK